MMNAIKKRYFFMVACGLLIGVCGNASTIEKGKRFLVDKVVARVNGVSILYSDTQIPRIAKEGGLYSLDECIIEEVFFQKAVERHLQPSTVDIERQIVAFKIQNNLSNLSDTEFEEQLKKSGITLKMYREQMGRIMAVESVRRAEVSEKIFVTSQEVEAYHKANPRFVKEGYWLHVAQCETEDAPEDTYRWQDLGWVDKCDLDASYDFVASMEVGSISKPVKNAQGYQVIKVIEKRMPRPKTLDERYVKIEKLLRDEKRTKYLEGVEKELLEKAHIVHL